MRTVESVLGLLMCACAGISALAVPLSEDIQTSQDSTKPPGIKLPGGPGSKPNSPGQQKSGDQLVQLRCATDVDRIQPGMSFYVAAILEIEPQWHVYWMTPGSSGAPTEARVSGPPGFIIGKPLFPRPVTMHGEDGDTYGYDGQVALLVPVTAPADLRSGIANFSVDAEWFVCKEICLVGKGRASTSVAAIGSPNAPAAPSSLTNNDDRNLVQRYLKRLPKPLKDISEAQTDFDGKTLTIRLPSQGHREAEFFPLESPGVTYGKPRFDSDDKQMKLTVDIELKPGDSLGKPMKIAGVIGLGRGLDDPCYEFELPAQAP